MKTIRAAIEIAQAQEVVFDLTQNYAKRLEWDPYLSEAYLMKNATEPAVGVDAYCKNHNGSVMVFYLKLSAKPILTFVPKRG